MSVTRLLLLAAAFAFVACSPTTDDQAPDVFRVPEISLEKPLNPEIYAAWIAQIDIRPAHAKLTRQQLATLSHSLLQVDGVCVVEGFDGRISSSSRVFRALDNTFKDDPGWPILLIRSTEKGYVEAFAISAYIDRAIAAK
jgi:hypothetical protein